MSLRIVAGRWGGRTLVAPPGRGTRPTSDRVREALFSILGPLDGLRVLDLFAGSGALGLEALSRGAAQATLVERERAALRALRANVDALEADAEVVAGDARAFLRSAREQGAQYDLVFLDPPYRAAAGLAQELALAPVLADGARVVGESDRREPLDLDLPLTDERRYGDTLIRIHTRA
jgi:16S rRNA (guanine(966)-N(2))-methyltransferase RsmD